MLLLHINDDQLRSRHFATQCNIKGIERTTIIVTMTAGIGLLYIPIEIRLTIYEALIHHDIDIEERKTRKEKCSDSSGRPAYLTPWCALMLVCRQTASELRHHMAKQRLLGAGQPCILNTWVLGLDSNHANSATRIESIRMPCSPAHVKALRVDVPLHKEYKAWTIALALDMNISRLVRSGPRLNADEYLLKPLRFGELQLAFSWVDREEQPLYRKYRLAEMIALEFRRIQRRSSMDEHPLRGAIDSVQLVTEYYEQSWSMYVEKE